MGGREAHLGTFKRILLLLAYSILVQQTLLKLLHLYAWGQAWSEPRNSISSRRAGPCGVLHMRASASRALLERGPAHWARLCNRSDSAGPPTSAAICCSCTCTSARSACRSCNSC